VSLNRKLPLGDVLQISSERIDPLNFADRSFNFIGLENIESHTGRIIKERPTAGSEIQSTKNVFHKGQILYGKLRPYLNKVYLAEKGGICSTDIFVLSCDKSLVTAKFVAYCLRSEMVLETVKNLTVGANLPRVDAKGFLSIEIPVPPLLEQERSVRILDEVEALRRLRVSADDRMEAMGSALFHEMFGSPASDWPKDKLGNLGSLDRGKSRYRPRDEPSLFGGPYPFIQTGDVANSSGNITTFSQTYSDFGLAQSRLWPAGTLCITIAANIAKTGMLGFDACFPDSVVGFTPNDRVRVEFIQFWLRTLQGQLEEEAPQAAQRNINLQTLRELELFIPPIGKQNEFVDHIAKIRELRNSQTMAHLRLDELFRCALRLSLRGDL